MRIFSFLLFIVVSLQTANAFDPSKIEESRCNNAIECAMLSVVSVLPVWPASASRNTEPEGSGVVVADGYTVVTANHVLGKAKQVFVRTLNGKVFRAEIVYRDQPTDIALIKIERKMRPIQHEISAMVGEEACAIGNSFGLDISVTCGVVSAKQLSGTGFNPIEDFIQTDAAVNPGMSGGALVNKEGRLIGMLSAIFTKNSDSNIGVNFAVSSELLMKVEDDFLRNGKVSHFRSGILLRPALKPFSEGDAGAQVVRVDAASPEANAGIQVGDVVLFANQRRIKRAGAYTSALALLEKGNKLVMEILRDGIPKTITVQF